MEVSPCCRPFTKDTRCKDAGQWPSVRQRSVDITRPQRLERNDKIRFMQVITRTEAKSVGLKWKRARGHAVVSLRPAAAQPRGRSLEELLRRGVVQSGSELAWGARGPEFKS